MKIIQLILVFNFIAISVFSQLAGMKYDSVQKMYYKQNGKDTVFVEMTPFENTVFIERKAPVFIGNMEKFMKENLVYPEEARKMQLEGYVDVYCPIDSNGIPMKIFVMYTTSPLFEKEAERIVRLMRWRWDESEIFKEYWAEQIRVVFKL